MNNIQKPIQAFSTKTSSTK